MVGHRITRRSTLKAAAATAALQLVHVRTAGAAGRLLEPGGAAPLLLKIGLPVTCVTVSASNPA
jgi:hypothetical protein